MALACTHRLDRLLTGPSTCLQVSLQSVTSAERSRRGLLGGDAGTKIAYLAQRSLHPLPILRVDNIANPAQLGRLEEMTTNAEARLAEAPENVWLGEDAALEEKPDPPTSPARRPETRRTHPNVEFS
jgi:hypothetical protein